MINIYVVPVTERVNIDLPRLLSPLSASKTSGSNWHCYYGGPVSISVKIDQGGYCPAGNSILINMEVTNNSRREITAVQAILKQRVVFQGRCNYHPRCDVGTCKTKVIQTVEDHDIAENRGIYNWINKPLLVPNDLAPTISSCKSLEVSYNLIVSLLIRSTSDLSVKFPIIIGNRAT